MDTPDNPSPITPVRREAARTPIPHWLVVVLAMVGCITGIEAAAFWGLGGVQGGSWYLLAYAAVFGFLFAFGHAIKNGPASESPFAKTILLDSSWFVRVPMCSFAVTATTIAILGSSLNDLAKLKAAFIGYLCAFWLLSEVHEPVGKFIDAVFSWTGKVLLWTIGIGIVLLIAYALWGALAALPVSAAIIIAAFIIAGSGSKR